MQIIIKTKNLDLDERLKNFIETRMGGLKKFIDVLKKDDLKGEKTLAEVFVEVEKETEHHKKGKIYLVKAQIKLPGKDLMAQFKADEPMKAVGGAKDELKLEIEKYKFKHIDKNRRLQRKSKDIVTI
jgi:ribosome-associated translation inhibitor RaiA